MAKQNNSDWMSEYQDKELERIEKDISSLYSNAAKEVEAEFAKFTESSEKQMVAMQGKLEAGEITKSEYQVWVQKQMLQTDRYKATVNHMTDILAKSDKAAMAVVNGKLPTVVAESYNFSQALGFEAAKKAGLSVGTFQVYNAKSVQKIIKDNPKLLKEVDVPEDKKWNQTKINREITTGMLKGEPIPKISDRLRRVTDMDKNAATRNARTAMTAAENVGRSESAEELKEKGIPVEEVWSAAIDKRTRETHILLDGTVKDENGFFGADILLHPLRYPADPDGDPEEIYNCRCRLNIQLKGIDHSNDKDLYEKFMKENDPDSYKRIREVDEPKEEAYQKNKEKAERNLSARQERIREAREQEITEQLIANKQTKSTKTKAETESVKSISKKIEESPFSPASTIGEAEQYAKDNFIDGGGFTLTKAGSSFDGISIDAANKINQRLTSIYDNFNINKMASLESYGKKDKKLFATNGEAPMITNPFGCIGLNNTYFKSMSIIEKYREEGSAAFAYVADNLDALSGAKREKAEAYIKAGRDLVDNSVEGMITHEVGHLMSFQDVNKELAEVGKGSDWSNYAKNISGYATTSYSEYIAESFTAYYNGEYDILQPEIKDIFDSLRKEK